MLGSSSHFKNYDNDTDDIVVVQDTTTTQWDKNRPRNDKSISTNKLRSIPQRLLKISKQIVTYLAEGWSDTTIQETLISSFIKSDDVASIYWCLDVFKNLPKKLLVDLLAFSLRSSDKVFVPLQNGTVDDISMSPNNNSYSRNDFLDKVLSINCSASMLPHLKTGLTSNEVLRLLEYVTDKLNEQIDSLDSNPQPSEQQLYEWSYLLYNSHYQHYVASPGCNKNENARILEVFSRLSSVLEEQVQFLQDLENLRPMLERTINGKLLQSSSTKYNKFYSIEEIKFY